MDRKDIQLLGIAGSLRAASRSRALLKGLWMLLPEGVSLSTFSLDEVPLYNGDLEDDRRPPPVRELREAISCADGLVLVAPEYNHSIPGVLKNALDWSSRPAYRSPLHGKPVVGIGVSNGLIGGARGIQHLKTILSSTGAELYPGPEALVGRVSEKLADDGRLVDPATADFLASTLTGFADWIRRRGLVTSVAGSSSASS